MAEQQAFGPVYNAGSILGPPAHKFTYAPTPMYYGKNPPMQMVSEQDFIDNTPHSNYSSVKEQYDDFYQNYLCTQIQNCETYLFNKSQESSTRKLYYSELTYIAYVRKTQNQLIKLLSTYTRRRYKKSTSRSKSNSPVIITNPIQLDDGASIPMEIDFQGDNTTPVQPAQIVNNRIGLQLTDCVYKLFDTTRCTHGFACPGYLNKLDCTMAEN